MSAMKLAVSTADLMVLEREAHKAFELMEKLVATITTMPYEDAVVAATETIPACRVKVEAYERAKLQFDAERRFSF